tara:strand:+ start:502 stop:924 length:423 start_codon:yes stop_codon:yes gene_type:complete
MATTTATITLSSADMMDNNISISNTATLTNQGNDTGMTKTTGLARQTIASSSNLVLLDSGASGGTAAQQAITKGKVYIKNINDRGDGTKYVTVLLQAAEIGRLYGGDWMFFPWEGGSGNDVEVTASDTTSTVLEYIVFHE